MRERPAATPARRVGVLSCALVVSVAAAVAVLSVVVAGWSAWTAVTIGDLAVAAAGVVVLARHRSIRGGRSSTVVVTVLIIAMLAVATTVATWCHLATHGG